MKELKTIITVLVFALLLVSCNNGDKNSSGDSGAVSNKNHFNPSGVSASDQDSVHPKGTFEIDDRTTNSESTNILPEQLESGGNPTIDRSSGNGAATPTDILPEQLESGDENGGGFRPNDDQINLRRKTINTDNAK